MKSRRTKRMQGTLTPYESTEGAVKAGVSRAVRRLLKGAPDPQSVLRLEAPMRSC